MRSVFSHSSPTIAHAARDQLLSRGILSAVVSRTEGLYASIVGYDVILCFGKQAPEAAAILAEPGWAEPAEAGWESDELPNLALLDPAKAPECPGCRRILPLNAALETCPSCACAVDVAELIVAAHGPEALEPCYEVPAPADSDLIGRLHLLCPACQYALDGLPISGTCPECGRFYDKQRIVQDFVSV